MRVKTAQKTDNRISKNDKTNSTRHATATNTSFTYEVLWTFICSTCSATFKVRFNAASGDIIIM